MCAKLNDSIVVQRLAEDLGLRASIDPVKSIVEYCHRRTRNFLKNEGPCHSLTALLALLANKLGARLVEINNDEELERLQPDVILRDLRELRLRMVM